MLEQDISMHSPTSNPTRIGYRHSGIIAVSLYTLCGGVTIPLQEFEEELLALCQNWTYYLTLLGLQREKVRRLELALAACVHHTKQSGLLDY